MAVKTITIDMEAYNLLARHKKDGQSFSQTIKAHFGEQPTAGRLLQRVRGIKMGQEYIDDVRKIIRERKLDPPRPVEL
jgi:predicted CopG family antitoxin